MKANDTYLTYAGDCVNNLQLHLNQDLENVLNWLRADVSSVSFRFALTKGLRSKPWSAFLPFTVAN